MKERLSEAWQSMNFVLIWGWLQHIGMHDASLSAWKKGSVIFLSAAADLQTTQK